VPFDHFRDTIMPALTSARKHRRAIRIWCAASSTGQEPYSLAMMLKEMGAGLSGWRVEIVATDLSGEVLEKSKSGIFSQFEVQRGLPIQMLVKYFKQSGELWQLNADIRGMVQHRQLNLLHDFSPLGTFDVIFCRNVLIYFDQDTKTSIFNRLARATEADGFLVLGAAETVVGLTDTFKPYPERRGLYRLNDSRAAKMPAGGAKFAAALSSDARLLVFPLEEVNELPNGGRGVMAMKLHDNEAMLGLQPVTGEIQIAAFGRSDKRTTLVIKAGDLAHYRGNRARTGRKLEPYFKRIEGFEPAP